MSSALTKGSELPKLIKPPITKEQLKAYAAASRDHNPIHLDDAIAKSAGLPGVIAHGMLTMAFAGEFLHQALNSLGGGRIAEMSCRFKAMTYPGDVITVTGVVRAVRGSQIDCDMQTTNQKGEITTTGHAVLELHGS